MHVSCVVVDFDATLAGFRGGHGGLFAIFTRRGVDTALLADCYALTKQQPSGFSISALTSVVTEQMGRCFDAGAVAVEFGDWLKCSLIPYPDSVPILTRWRQQGMTVVILTAGNSEYQAQKVRATEMPYDRLIVVPQGRDKLGVVRELLARYGSPVWVLDDQPSVLDLMRESGLAEGDVVTVRVLRDEGPYIHELSKYGHFLATDLNDVSRLFEN